MKFLLAALLFVGAALGNSTHRYAWQPKTEYQYRYESRIDFSIPEIRADQSSGLMLAGIIRVQAQNDYSLLIKLTEPRFKTLNGLAHEVAEKPIPADFKVHLEAAFRVYLKRGVFEAMFVDANEPVAVTNIKKAIVANLNMDLSASRQSEVLTNHIEIDAESPLAPSYFTVREQSLHGDCKTIYNIHPLAAYEALEIEEELEMVEKERSLKGNLQGGLSQGRAICEGKKYWQITKTRDFDNCLQSPVFQRWHGIVATSEACDTSKGNCKDLMNYESASNYIVCGNNERDFVIRKSFTENAVVTIPAWNMEEKMVTKSEIEFALLKQETVSIPMVLPSSLKEIKSLVFQYQNQQSEATTFLPLPDLVSAPKMLVPLENEVVIPSIIEKLVILSDEIYKPNSCASKDDVVGQLDIFVKALRPLSLVDLKAVETKLEARITSLRGAQRKVIRTLFYDIVAMIGTNPAIMLVKERLLHPRIDAVQAVAMVQSVIANVRTPTPQLLKELITLVKVDLKPVSQDRTILYNLAIVQTSNLVHRACIAPAKSVSFPTGIYGEFCTPTSEPVIQWIEFLKQQLETESNHHIRLNIITAIGKLGHIKSVEILKPVISNTRYNEMVRSLAVYSLKRVASLEPAQVKPVLMSIIENIAERPEVRIAAIATLPHAKPTTAELKMIAVRTWLEPSKEVASFIYSTLKSLSLTEDPELKTVGLQVHGLMTLVKPVVFNPLYAQNLHFTKLVNYLQMVVHQEISWVKSPESIVPARWSQNALLFAQGWGGQSSAYTFYTRGMDKWVDMILKYTRKIQTSSKVEAQLKKISEDLGITQKPIDAPEIFAQYGIFDAEMSHYLNEPIVVEALSQLAQDYLLEEESLNDKMNFEIVKTHKPLSVEGVGPSDAGFPIYFEESLPFTVALKGHVKMKLEEVNGVKIPKMLQAKIVPVVNTKFETNMGVISPFTQEIIGMDLTMAAHLNTPLEMTVSRKMSQVVLDIKIPKEVQRETALIHLFVSPVTYMKKLTSLRPITQAYSLKPILSDVPLKKFNMNIGAPLEIDAKVVAESDAKYTDLYSYLEKIRQHSPITFLRLGALPFSMRKTSIMVLFNPETSRTREITLAAGLLKHTASEPLSNEKLVHFCNKAVPEAMCQENTHKVMSSLESYSHGLAFRLDAQLVGTNKAFSTAIALGYKTESSTVKDTIAVVSNIHVKTPATPVYEIEFLSTAEIPRVNMLRNKEKLLQQALQVIFNGQVELGFKTGTKETIRMKSLLVKSEQQIESVRNSPEFLRCTQEEQLGRPFAEVCELVRHQASFVDEVRTELVIPAYFRTSKEIKLIVPNIVNVLKTLVIGNLIETPSNHISADEMKIILKVSRVGDEAQLIIDFNGQRYEVRNIRFPALLKGILPISLRTPFRFVGLNRLNRIASPTCHVGPTHVSTFDSKMLNYELNNCFHLLFKDCSGKIPVAVMARNLHGASKEVKILAGISEVLMTPISANNMKIQLNMNGQQQIIKVQPGEVKVIRHNGLEILEIKMTQDNAYEIYAVQEGLFMTFDGKHAQIFGNYLLRSRSCGLCGDLDAEITADLKTPKRCIMSRPRFAAYSYMIQNSCQGIPSQDLAKYEQEMATCVKQETIPTKL